MKHKEPYIEEKMTICRGFFVCFVVCCFYWDAYNCSTFALLAFSMSLKSRADTGTTSANRGKSYVLMPFISTAIPCKAISFLGHLKE